MGMQLVEKSGGRVLEAHVSDKLTDDDYKTFVPRFEELIRQHGKVNVLFDMSGFHGWEARALWDDIKFDAKHFNDMDRVAMVGDKQWQHWMSVFCKPFTTAKVRYFEKSEESDARAWLDGI